MTVVTTFGVDDLSGDQLATEGARRLRRLLASAEGRAGVSVTAGGDAGELDALERSIAARLRADGLPVHVRYGTRGQVLVALAHPEDDNRMVLAVETDGPAYRDGGPARDRDRLRPEHLERLGWRHLRVWTPAWAADPDLEAARVRTAWEAAVRAARADDVAAAAAAEAASRPPAKVSVPHPGADRRPDPRPRVPAGRAVTDCTPAELAALAAWVASDARPRSNDELVLATLAELGYARTEPRLEARVRAALRREPSR
jgi:hypothetical protein